MELQRFPFSMKYQWKRRKRQKKTNEREKKLWYKLFANPVCWMANLYLQYESVHRRGKISFTFKQMQKDEQNVRKENIMRFYRVSLKSVGVHLVDPCICYL